MKKAMDLSKIDKLLEMRSDAIQEQEELSPGARQRVLADIEELNKILAIRLRKGDKIYIDDLILMKSGARLQRFHSSYKICETLNKKHLIFLARNWDNYVDRIPAVLEREMKSVEAPEDDE